MSFKGIAGNDNVKELLTKQVENGHVVHSYLFVGIDGIGKTLFAREFARMLLCIENEESQTCTSCIKWNSRKPSRFLPNRSR